MRPLALCALLAAVHVPWLAAAAPTSVTLVGDLQSELGCASDSDPSCTATQLEPEASDGVWQKSFNVPAGTWHYKVALDGSASNTHPSGADLTLTLSAPTSVKFYYDPISHFVSDSVKRIAVAPGSFQSEVGCPGDWQPDCLKTWLQDPDGNGIFVYTTTSIPVGTYEAKVAINESWSEAYGDRSGNNVVFTVTQAGELVTFSWDSVSKRVSIRPANAPTGDILMARVHWLTPDTLAWDFEVPPTGGGTYQLYHEPSGAMQLGSTGIQGGTAIPLTVDPAGLSTELKARFPHLSNAVVLKLPQAQVANVPALLKGQLALSLTSSAGRVVDATSVQMAGVLDELYTYPGELGATFDAEGTPTLRVWAPTARSVKLLIFDDSTAATPAEILDMTAGEQGTWSVTGTAAWAGKFYLYEVEVYVRREQAVRTNRVTDPYSVSLSMNSTRSQIIDLNAPTLAPQGWSELAKPALAAPEDIVLYELHVRDFSINDATVPEAERGTFKAFTRDSNGTRHLTRIAKAGVTHVHLLPVFDIATINENKAAHQQPAGDLAALPPDSEQQQAAVNAVRDADAFNWGYDPYHYTVPEGSYSTNPDGTARIVEFREMVQSLNQRGLRVVMDVVYNHTNSAGQDPLSVLDRIVPGYYHRLSADGNVETSTCCQNTATENAMMEKLMVDSLVTWAKLYKVDGFRFDLMGHHMKANMEKVRAALNALTLSQDGVNGRAIYVYGEGWNFGEVANGARGKNATQLNMPGTGIGTFSDRLRDAARGGGPFSGLQEQGFISGLFTDPNSTDQGTPQQQKSLLLQHMDRIRVGLAGNLRDYSLTASDGTSKKGSELKYGSDPAGYTLDPQEVITYVSAHDNETLFDAVQLKAPRNASMDTRVRMHNMGISLVALGQGIPFFHAGDELLRSKSLDRNSFNSGDWFNKLDWTYQSNNWGVGLPPAADNQTQWPIMKPLLADPALKPGPAHITRALEHFEEVIRIRKSSNVFRLRTAGDIQRRVRFLNTGPEQIPGLIVMAIEGDQYGKRSEYRNAVVLFNGSDEEQRFTEDTLKDSGLELHPVLKESTDPAARTSAFDATVGTFTVPARTTAVFVEGMPASKTVPVSGELTESSGCAAGGAVFSAFALLLGLGALRRPRRRSR
ncbi:pullulanase-type alpha-1,6-glucosidase [Hyalangium rubrum]|uniref:Pullulanase-type alpha-1,6-glucosidase n=1 Tax=Hyalangium rubrum TaxID=3103134 RepID=A0ABU5H653_9BACT|nr:pullulanase-type alpha-1,6-glucosidase [Hyalangium sp. s54d21]MDY7227575.1 pullulanase-type alpha-1,6-glucosidase [Hyalangium sp. s54d21]